MGVLRFWESDIRANLEGCVGQTLDVVLNRNRSESPFPVPGKTFAEFFAGIGLMRIGLEGEGWTCSFANDIDPAKHEMYSGHFGGSEETYLVRDVHEIHGDDVPSVRLATASFPCTDLSLAGARQGLSGQQSSAFWGFLRAMDEMGDRRPSVLLIENVPGFLTSKRGLDFQQAMLGLNRLGYAADAFIINAARFVPQSRERLFIVGSQHESDFAMIGETRGFYESAVRPRPLADFIITHPEVKWNIRDLPQLPSGSKSLNEIIENLPDDSRFWWNDARTRYLLDQMSPKHREIAEQMMTANEWSYGTVFSPCPEKRGTEEING